MKKKVILFFLTVFMLFSVTSCSQRMTLLFLNWGEYIDESLLDAFEEKYNCNVLMDLGESNEIFYSKVFAGTTVYDVVDNGIANCMALIIINNDSEFKYFDEESKNIIKNATRRKLNYILERFV